MPSKSVGWLKNKAASTTTSTTGTAESFIFNKIAESPTTAHELLEIRLLNMSHDCIQLAKAAVETDARGDSRAAIDLYEQTVKAMLRNMTGVQVDRRHAQALEAKVAEYVERIEQLRRELPQPFESPPPGSASSNSVSTILCSTCTFENTSTAEICEMCGTAISAAAAPTPTQCPTCTFENPAGSVGCALCGTQLTAGGPSNQQSPPPPPPSHSSVPAPPPLSVPERLDRAERERAERERIERERSAAAAEERQRQQQAAEAAEALERQQRAASVERQQQAAAERQRELGERQAAAERQRQAAAEAAAAEQQAAAAERQRQAAAAAEKQRQQQAAAVERERQAAADRVKQQQAAQQAAADAKRKRQEAAAAAATERERQQKAQAIVLQQALQGKAQQEKQQRAAVEASKIDKNTLYERELALSTDSPKCKGCTSGFGMMRWRKRCNYCGHSFCGSCLSKTAVLPSCFGFGSSRQAVCDGCCRRLADTYSSVLAALQPGLTDEEEDDDTVLISAPSRPPRAVVPDVPGQLKSPTGSAGETSLAARVLNAAATSIRPPEPDSPNMALPLGFQRPELQQLLNHLPAMPTMGAKPAPAAPLPPPPSYSHAEQPDALPLGFQRNDLQERAGIPLPGSGDSQPEQELPLGFQRLDLKEQRGVPLPGSLYAPDSPDGSASEPRSPGGGIVPLVSPLASRELPLGFGFQPTRERQVLGLDAALGESDISMDSDGPLPLGLGMGMPKASNQSDPWPDDENSTMEFASLRQLMNKEPHPAAGLGFQDDVQSPASDNAGEALPGKAKHWDGTGGW